MRQRSGSTLRAPERVNFRVDKRKKELIERAAAIKGLSVTDFAVTTLCREASDVVKNEEVLVLSDHDRDAFLAVLDNPPKPAAKLLKAAADYKRGKADGRIH